MEDKQFISFVNSEEFQNKMRETIKADTWEKGKPMVYLNKENEIIYEFKDGTILNVSNSNNTLDTQYIDLLKHILSNGTIKGDRTGAGTKSVFSTTIRHSMKDGFPLLTTKKLSFKNIVSEALWFLKGRTDLRYLLENKNYIWVGDSYNFYKNFTSKMEEPDYFYHVDDPKQNCTRIMNQEEFIERIKTDDNFNFGFGNLGKIYGHQWTYWNDDINQIDELIKSLKTNPDSRRQIVTAWNPSELNQQILPPCHILWQVYTRELTLNERVKLQIEKNDYASTYSTEEMDINNIPKRSISLMWYQRSADTPLGVPYNIASYGLILSLIAKQVNMIPDELIGVFGDTHIYLPQIESVSTQLDRSPYPLPLIKIKDGVESLSEYELSDITLHGYISHDKIDIPLFN